jgi:hypothetical protein
MINMRERVVVKVRKGAIWVNSTDGILNIDISRGIPQYVGCWSQVQPGQLQLRSRDLSLADLALQTRIRIEVDGSAIFTGRVFDINTEYIPRDDSIVTITAFDQLGTLSLKKFGHQTVIGGDYKPREIASYRTFPQMLNSYNQSSIDPGIPQKWDGYASQGTLQMGATANALDYQILNTTYGVAGFNPAAPAPGASSDSTWGPYLNSDAYDVDGGVICNPSAGTLGWGTPVVNTQGTGTQTGMEDSLNYRDNIMGGTIFQASSASRSQVAESGHPLNGATGLYAPYYAGTFTSPLNPASWAALMTTNDTDGLTLFLKAEQSEAGFAYVDVKNRFRLLSRAVVENDHYLSEARFASDGSGISYNAINVTNGWESVVNGVTINNTWSNTFIDSDEMIPWVDNGNDGSTTGYYQNAQNGNRNFTTGTVKLNESADVINDPTKEYSWLGFNITEAKQRYLRYCKLNNNTMPIYKFDTRDFSLDKLTTTSFFQGQTGLGTKQLSIDTTYAMPMNSGPGYLWTRTGSGKIINRTTESPRAYNVIQRQSELANYIVTNYANPTKDIRSISYGVHPEDVSAIKNIEIYDRITIDHNDDGFVVDKQYAVMGISHSITPLSWDITYQLWNQQGRP